MNADLASLVGKTINTIEDGENEGGYGPPRFHWKITFTDGSEVYLQCDDPYCFIRIVPESET